MKIATQVRSEYVAIEDRLRLSCELQGGDVVNLWLTQRLTLRLAVRLLSWLESQAPEGGAVPREVSQAMAQMSAQRDPSAQASSPVQPDKAMDGWLVTKIDMSTHPQMVVVVFRSESPYTPEIRLDFRPVMLRKWLGLLCRQCEAGEWPMGIWPEWLRQASRGKMPEGWSGLGRVIGEFR